jgi:glycosyltransferase involved in cell wall biosynthesis
MKFWIVTPSYNSRHWLERCIASARDQCARQPIQVHHHIQDGGSTDGTIEYLTAYRQSLTSARPHTEKSPYTFSYAHEKDDGMYDAINRGWRLAPDGIDVIAHLNSDEQYLPGALSRMAEAFDAHPHADVLLADLIVIDKGGRYLCHRRSLAPHPLISRHCCAGMTASTFQRAAVTRTKGVFFDTRWRIIGDKVWYMALHAAGCRFRVVHDLVAVFVNAEHNLSWTGEGARERELYRRQNGWGKWERPAAKWNGWRRLLLEWRHAPPKTYDIFIDGTGPRVSFSVEKPTGRWRNPESE